MRRFPLTVLAIVGAVLVVGGLVAAASAREPDGPTTSAVDATASSTPQPAVATSPSAKPAARMESFVASVPRTETFRVLDVGVVTLEIDDVLRVADVQLARAGWRVEVQALGREVEVSFRGDGQRVDWKAEHDDGQVRVRVRDRRGEGSRRGPG